MSNLPSAQAMLAALALVGLGVIGTLMCFVPVPVSNTTILATIVGAFAGAATMSVGGKIADKITNSSGPNASVQPDAPKDPQPPT